MNFTEAELNQYSALILAAIGLGITVVDGWKRLIGALRQDLTPEQLDAAFVELAARADVRAALREHEAQVARALAIDAQDDGA